MPTGARIHSTTNLILPTGVQTAVPFNTVKYDDAGYFNPLFPTRLTIPVAGRYHVFAGIAMNTSPAVYSFADSFIYVNHATVIARDKREIDPGNSSWTLSTIWNFVAGDYLEVMVWKNSAYQVMVFSAPYYSPEFGVELIP